VRGSGAKRTFRWAIRYRVVRGRRRDKRQRRLAFGELDGAPRVDLAELKLEDFKTLPSKLGLEEARDVARVLLALSLMGRDPRAELEAATAKAEKEELEAARREAEGTLTVGMLVDRMIKAREEELRPATVASWRGLARTWLSELRDRDPSTVTARDVRRWHKAIGAKGRKVTANRALELVSVTYSWAMNTEDQTGEPLLAGPSPCVGIKPFPERPRERVLSSDELRRIWPALDFEPYGDAIRLLLWTGARLRELIHAEWSEFDLPERRWTVPAERSKTRVSRRVPLCSSALTCLERRCTAAPKARWVFPSPVAAVGPIRGLQSVIRSVQRRSGTSGWSAHDLRRTVRTGLSAVGVRPDVGEFILGHKVGGIRGVYDRHEPLAEAASALEGWARRLHAIVSGEEPDNAVLIFAK
jgi:integrase